MGELRRNRRGALRPLCGEPIELAEVKQAATLQATGNLESWVRLAKAETLIDRGDRRAAVALIQEHLA